METLFKRLSAFSATTILIILTSIFIVLFIQAKPAIKAYGIHFLVDPRWGVVVSVDNNKNKQNNLQNQQNTQTNTITQDNFDDENSDMGLNNDMADSELGGIPVDDEDALAAAGIVQPQNTNTKTIYGGLIPIVGTILSTLIAMFFAVPIAMGIAIFLAEIAPEKIAKPVGIAIELLAAIPSIIYGMWGLFYFGPFISHIFGGSSVSLLVAGLVLGIMIIPFMASLTRDSMKTTPNVLKESAYAMGATKFEVIKDVIFPYAKTGIIGSMILALGRALGETMAVAFVIGGVFKFPSKITDPTVSIPVVLANNFAESSGMSLAALFYLALILFVISFIVITFAKFYFLGDKK
ncbi:phosphate ABC transporter permease subunit PstC [Caminibacter sp.]